jgi:hypothetical protein
MSTEYLALGTPVVLAAATAVRLSVGLDDKLGATPTINSSDSAYLTIAAGTYRFPELCQLVISKILTWFATALDADADCDLTGTPVITLVFAPSTSAGASTVTLTFTTVGGETTAGGDPLYFASVTLDNSNGLWTLLGLAYETEDGTIESNRAVVDVADVVTIASRFQPRSIFVFDRSVEDTFDSPHYPQEHSHVLASLKTRRFGVGIAQTHRSLRLVDLSAAEGGPGQVVANFSAHGSNRSLITINNPSVTGLSGISALYVQNDLITAGRYLRCGEWVSRARADTTTQVSLCDKIPTAVSVASAAPITLISELEALWFDVRRLGGKLYLWETTDAGAIRWTGAAYAPVAAPRMDVERRDVFARLWSYSWGLTRADDAEFTLAS